MKVRKILTVWMYPIIWRSIIFYFSSRQRVQMVDEQVVNFIFFKALHIIEYAFLYFLLFQAYNKTFKDSSIATVRLMSYVTCIMLAVSDEIHQTYVPSREGSPRDILIDFIGMIGIDILIRKGIVGNILRRLKK